jgi:4-nitrophenyl phosphatase
LNVIVDRLEELDVPEALLFDLDGTLYRGNERILGADRLISELQELGIPCWFVTNNSTRSPTEVAKHLREMGIPADETRIVTSATAAAYYVREYYSGASAFVIGEQGLLQALRDEGIRIVPEDTPEGEIAQLVVQGLDRKLTYDRLTQAVKHLLGGATFVQTNPDRLLPVDGGFLPGAGSLGAVLETATGVKPIIIGKPSIVIMDYALLKAGTLPARTWVIGDNPYTDLAAGRNAGCPSILMLTGLCTDRDWRKHCETAEVQPDAVCMAPSDLAELLRRALSR